MRNIARLRWVGSAWRTCAFLPASDAAQHVDPDIQLLRSLLAQPESRIDLARAKLTIDRLIDPAVDIEATLGQLDRMAAAIRLRAGGARAPSCRIAETLRSFLYDPGDWNHGRPFRYDLSDPLGRKLSNKLLSNYLATRQGNCVSMPALFVVLAQRLGLDATFATSPQHVFVKLRNESGHWINLEATCGGHARSDSHYLNDTPMTPLALRQGIYLQPLSRKQSIVGPLMDVLYAQCVQTGSSEKLMALADLALEFEPRSIDGMLLKGRAFGLLIERDFRPRYSSLDAMPPAERARYLELRQGNALWFHKAEALGWREPEADADAKYLESFMAIASQRPALLADDRVAIG